LANSNGMEIMSSKKKYKNNELEKNRII
jgi:hypothetical protein